MVLGEKFVIGGWYIGVNQERAQSEEKKGRKLHAKRL